MATRTTAEGLREIGMHLNLSVLNHSNETLIIEPEKNASRIESLEQEKADEEEEGKKDESSCSSEEDEEDDSESEAETGKTGRKRILNCNCTIVGVWSKIGFSFKLCYRFAT